MTRNARRLARAVAADGDLIHPSRLRQAVVAARDPATLTCSLYVGGDTSSTVAGISALAGYVPRVGDVVWVDQTGPRLLIVGGQGTELPKAKLWSTGTQTVAAAGVPEKFDFSSGSGNVAYDTDTDGTNTMADLANSRLYVRWPGKYAFGAGSNWAANVSGGSQVFLDIKINGTVFSEARFAVRQDQLAGAATISGGPRAFVAGDYIELFVTSTAQVRTFGTGTGELGARLWLTHTP